MFRTPPEPRFDRETRYRVTQYVRIGDRRWLTQVEGFIVQEDQRPVGGIEMGQKASYCRQSTIKLRGDDGDFTVIALDEHSQVEAVSPMIDEFPPIASSDAEWKSSGAVIVVHGVGNQERGSTIATLMQTIGKFAPGGSGSEVVARGDVLVKPPDPTMSHSSTTIQGHTSAYCPHAELRWSNNKAIHSLPFYEFFWADESRLGKSLWSQVRSFWQILVGLPRLGLYALDPPDGYQPNSLATLLDGALRFTYVAAWSALVVRFLVVLLMGACRLGGYNDGLPGLYHILAGADSIRTGANLAFLAMLCLWRVVSPRCGETKCSAVLWTALIALTAATMLTDLMALGIRFKMEDFVKSLALFGLGRGKMNIKTFDPNSYDPLQFYVANTITGLLWISCYVLVLLWFVWTSARLTMSRLWRSRTGATAPSDGSVDAATRQTMIWWGAVGFVLLLLHPLAFQYEWWSGAQNQDTWTLVTYYPKPTAPVHKVLNRVFIAYYVATNLVLLPFALFSFLFLTSTEARETLVPGLELALDVLNYLPPRPLIDAWSPVRFLLGGSRSVKQPALSYIFAARLRLLIELAGRQHGNRVRVVGHSLGSIIALSALKSWPATDLKVELTTIGCPLTILAERLPRAYGRGRPDGGRIELPTVIRWRNYYFNQDLIGRSLDPNVLGSGTASTLFSEGISLGDGTHTDYFSDDRFASAFVHQS
jgi:hypothetical protein